MSPNHVLTWAAGIAFQIINGASIGGWLAGYGPTTVEEWKGRTIYIQLGVVLFVGGLLGNMYHDEVLRDLRRPNKRSQDINDKSTGKSGNERTYKVPQDGLFQYILYPHYLCEWIEWCGFWMMCGLGCIPARSFVLNEISTMLPQALSGKRWYLGKFGQEKIGGKKAIIPGVL